MAARAAWRVVYVLMAVLALAGAQFNLSDLDKLDPELKACVLTECASVLTDAQALAACALPCVTQCQQRHRCVAPTSPGSANNKAYQQCMVANCFNTDGSGSPIVGPTGEPPMSSNGVGPLTVDVKKLREEELIEALVTLGLLTPWVLLCMACYLYAFGFQREARRLFESEGHRLKSNPSSASLSDSVSAMEHRDDVALLPMNSSASSNLGSGSTLAVGSGHVLACAFVKYWVDVTPRSAVGLRRGARQMKPILSGVSAIFRPGSVTAIMGASGSGKTTLLNLLAGRTKFGEWSGYRLINGNEIQPKAYQQFMRKQGYVLQEDCFLENLTVRETLLYEAMLRLPTLMSLQDKIARILSIIKEMGLESCTDAKVGGITFKGISGGQKRRLSIAIELLRMPDILLLDEPTSGLDATTSLKLAYTLSALAKNHNRVVITTIHQPRAEIFDTFDNILLLAVGGFPIFYGPASVCPLYLETMDVGIKRSDYHSPGDYIIDAVGLDPERAAVGTLATKSAFTPELASKWNNSAGSVANLQDIRSTIHSAVPEELDLHTHRGRFHTQVWVLVARKASRLTVINVASSFAKVAVLGLIFASTFSYHTEGSESLWGLPYKTIIYLFCLSSFAMMNQYLDIVPELFDERALLLAERESLAIGYPAYIAARTIIETPRAVFEPVILLGVGLCFMDLNTDSTALLFAFACLILGVLAWQAVESFIGLMLNDVGVVYLIVFMVFAGGTLFGGLCVPYSHIPPWFIWLYYTSVPSITFRMLVINDLKCCHLTVSCEQAFEYLSEYDPEFGAIPSQNCTFSQENQGEGNLGRFTLRSMDIEQLTNSESLVLLWVAFVGFRLLTVLVCKFRERRARKLKTLKPEDSLSGSVDQATEHVSQRNLANQEMRVRLADIERSGGNSDSDEDLLNF